MATPRHYVIRFPPYHPGYSRRGELLHPQPTVLSHVHVHASLRSNNWQGPEDYYNNPPSPLLMFIYCSHAWERQRMLFFCSWIERWRSSRHIGWRRQPETLSNRYRPLYLLLPLAPVTGGAPQAYPLCLYTKNLFVRWLVCIDRCLRQVICIAHGTLRWQAS